MTIYVTSDLHFNHKNILKFCPKSRDFKDVEEMNDFIIQKINEVVTAEDTLYILGDIALGGGVSSIVKLFNQLHCCDIRVVPGNHDSNKLLKSLVAQCVGVTILPLIYETSFNNTRAVMSHFPLLTWNQAHRGSIHLFGHCHGSLKEATEGRKADVGWDVWERPIPLEELVSILKEKPIWTPDHH